MPGFGKLKFSVSVLLLALCGNAGASTDSGAPDGNGGLQKGSLANQQLIRDALVGVHAKAGALGCSKVDAYQPYVLAEPQGTPGQQVWRERWVVSCQRHKYPIDIRFNESGAGAADWTIE